MHEYTKNDCEQTGYGFSLKGKVVVLNKAALPRMFRRQCRLV